jgi:periplasmic divalent cation tolerance protein
MSDYVVILVTAPDAKQAAAIASKLLNGKLVACANVVPGISSTFWWEGEIDSADEVLVIMKTRAGLLDAVIGAVREVHSYDVPEIIALPIVGGNADYLKWIDEAVGGNGEGRPQSHEDTKNGGRG